MKYKKITALVLATAMVAGSSMAVFAADANGAEGAGILIPHLDKEITAVTLPTDDVVANVFDYYVDPEALIKDAGTLADGTTIVTGNDDGVYFKNEGAAAVDGTVSSVIGADTNNDYIVTVDDLTVNETYTYDGTAAEWKDSESNSATVTITITESDGTTSVTPADGDTVTVSGAVAAGTDGYSSSSDAVEFVGKNSVNVDVTVTAAVETTTAGKDIALVADEAALTAATTPALLMTLKVGSDTKVITSEGATAKATILGVPGNFEVTTDSGSYKYAPKANINADTWKSTTVQLVGKTNQKDVPTGDNALTSVPKIKLTWSVAKSTTPVVTGTEASAITTSGTSDVLIRLVSGQNAVLSRITSAKVNGTAVASSNIAVSGSGNVWLKGVAANAGEYAIEIVYDGTTYVKTLTK